MNIEIIKENTGLYTLLFDEIKITDFRFFDTDDIVENADNIMERLKNNIILYSQYIKQNYIENGLFKKPIHYTTVYKETVPELDVYIKQLKIEKKQKDIEKDFI